MVVAPFTDAWCELWVDVARGVDLGPGPSGTWANVVRLDDGTIEAFTFVFRDGALTEVRLGRAAADVSFELPWAAFAPGMAGDRSEMQRAILGGGVRITGDPDALHVLGPHLNGERFQQVAARVYEQTAGV